jgi:hypothetical protein
LEQHNDENENWEELPHSEPLWQLRDRVTAQRKRLLAAGYHPLPVNGKAPSIRGWQDILATPTIIDKWIYQYPDSMSTGLLTRTAPAIDIDIINSEAATAVENICRDRFEEHGNILVRFGKAPKRAILLRTDEPFSKLSRIFTAPDGSEQKIEILANGQQVVLFGTHPETKRDYSWHGGEPGEIKREDLPYIREDDARAFLDEAATLLIKEFNFTEAPTSSASRDSNSNNSSKDNEDDLDSEIDNSSWSDLIANIFAGHNLHDSIRDLAASVIASGVNEAAAERLLHALMQASTAPHDERWQERYDDILRAVHSARRKFGQKKKKKLGRTPRSRCHSSTCRSGTRNCHHHVNGRSWIDFRCGKLHCFQAKARPARASCYFIFALHTCWHGTGCTPCQSRAPQYSSTRKTRPRNCTVVSRTSSTTTALHLPTRSRAVFA